MAEFDIDVVPDLCSASAQLGIEQIIFDSVAPMSPRLRLWQPQHALAVTTAEARQPAFAVAAARAQARGLAIVERKSGGGAVCLGPGTWVVSLLYTSAHNDIRGSYRDFAAPLTAALATLGVPVSTEEVTRAYCNGRFDLACRGQKLGGIAQRRRRLESGTRVWIHAVLSVELQSLDYPRAVTRFYADLGSLREADPTAVISVSQCLPSPLLHDDVMQRCSRAIVAAFQRRAQWGEPR